MNESEMTKDLARRIIFERGLAIPVLTREQCSDDELRCLINTLATHREAFDKAVKNLFEYVKEGD